MAVMSAKQSNNLFNEFVITMHLSFMLLTFCHSNMHDSVKLTLKTCSKPCYIAFIQSETLMIYQKHSCQFIKRKLGMKSKLRVINHINCL